MNVLSLNAGSSSLKFALHAIDSSTADRCLIRGIKEGGQVQAIGEAIEICSSYGAIDAVGCRVVHGGNRFFDPVVIDSEVIEAIKALAPLAPLHNGRDVNTIEAAQEAIPHTPVIAVFDTAFHRSITTTASTYALPKDLVDAHGLRRYGFHGISYRYVSEMLRAELEPGDGKLIICHLGSGASACAVLHGKSIDTSMGMTPLEGLVMGTRSGDVDPGLILFLQRELGMITAEVDRMLNHQSGLAGMSGLTGDVRELEQVAANGDAAAGLALEVFAYRVSKYIGAYAVALEGLNAIAFCGGIGENSPEMRQRICRRLTFLGVNLDAKLNSTLVDEHLRRIDSSGSVSVWVAKTDEERQIARETFAMLA
jgi:acetate kinase